MALPMYDEDDIRTRLCNCICLDNGVPVIVKGHISEDTLLVRDLIKGDSYSTCYTDPKFFYGVLDLGYVNFSDGNNALYAVRQPIRHRNKGPSPDTVAWYTYTGKQVPVDISNAILRDLAKTIINDYPRLDEALSDMREFVSNSVALSKYVTLIKNRASTTESYIIRYVFKKIGTYENNKPMFLDNVPKPIVDRVLTLLREHNNDR